LFGAVAAADPPDSDRSAPEADGDVTFDGAGAPASDRLTPANTPVAATDFKNSRRLRDFVMSEALQTVWIKYTLRGAYRRLCPDVNPLFCAKQMPPPLLARARVDRRYVLIPVMVVISYWDGFAGACAGLPNRTS
jgi:hypothetical protein